MSILLFPGQGSKADNFSNLANASVVQEVIGKTTEVLGYNVLTLTEEQLSDTAYSQISIFVKSMALFAYYKSQNRQVEYVGGHSLGQYSAAVATGAIELLDGLRLVQQRGELMSAACKEINGGMVACIGYNVLEVLNELLDNYSNVYIANYNSSQQIVVSGELSDLNRLIDELKPKNIRCIKLAVSGAFHSPLMEKANQQMNQIIMETKFHDTKVSFISNKSGDIILTGDKIQNELVNQMINPVRWIDVMAKIRSIYRQGMNIYEVSLSDVLTKLVKSELDIEVKGIV